MPITSPSCVVMSAIEMPPATVCSDASAPMCPLAPCSDAKRLDHPTDRAEQAEQRCGGDERVQERGERLGAIALVGGPAIEVVIARVGVTHRERGVVDEAHDDAGVRIVVGGCTRAGAGAARDEIRERAPEAATQRECAEHRDDPQQHRDRDEHVRDPPAAREHQRDLGEHLSHRASPGRVDR